MNRSRCRTKYGTIAVNTDNEVVLEMKDKNIFISKDVNDFGRIIYSCISIEKALLNTNFDLETIKQIRTARAKALLNLRNVLKSIRSL